MAGVRRIGTFLFCFPITSTRSMMKNKDVNANISRFFLFHHSFIKWSIWNIFLKILYLIYRLAFLARVSAVCWLSRYYTASSWLYPGTLLVTSLFHDASFPLGNWKIPLYKVKFWRNFSNFRWFFLYLEVLYTPSTLWQGIFGDLSRLRLPKACLFCWIAFVW